MGLIKKGGTKGLNVPTEKNDATRQVGTPGQGDATTPAEKKDATKQVGIPQRGNAAPPVDKSDATKQVGAHKREDATRTVQKPPADGGAAQGAPAPQQPAAQATAAPGTGLGTGKPGAKSEKRDVPQVLASGSVLQSRYSIEGVLGVGGMSVVYRGRDLRFKDVVRLCAIKEMFQTVSDSNTRMLNLQRFEREAGMLATFSHPAIPKVYDFFEEHGHCYLVMELVPGKDLETILEEEKQPISEERVISWAGQLCDVLSYLHNHQPEPIVFRDMKPSNVMLTSDDRIALIDFGIARIFTSGSQKGTMIGTEGYAPPEQYRGIAEPQGDIYALGATLHHLLTGSDPRLETPFTFHERPIRKFNASISPELEAAVTKALQYDISARWRTCEEFKQTLPGIGVGGMRTDGVAAPGLATATNRTSGTELVWRFQCEEEIRSSPRVSGGMLFVGCYDTNLYAVDIDRGEFRWKYATEGGISSSPAFWQDLIIIGSEDGTIYALDVRRGHLRWSFRTEQPIRSSPRVHDRVVLVGSDDRHFYALDGMRGTEIWKFRAWNPFRSSACIHDDSVFVGCDDSMVYCVDLAKGKTRWKQRTRQAVFSSPAYSDGLVFVGSMDSHLYALDSTSGVPVWRYRTGRAVVASPCVSGTTVFVGSTDGTMYALDTRKGRVTWSYEVGDQIASSPCVENGRVYFGAGDGAIYCIDAEAGNVVWKYQTEGAVVSSPTVVNGVVYIGSLDTYIYALKA